MSIKLIASQPTTFNYYITKIPVRKIGIHTVNV